MPPSLVWLHAYYIFASMPGYTKNHRGGSNVIAAPPPPALNPFPYDQTSKNAIFLDYFTRFKCPSIFLTMPEGTLHFAEVPYYDEISVHSAIKGCKRSLGLLCHRVLIRQWICKSVEKYDFIT